MRVRWLKEARIEAADSARFYGEKDADLGAALVVEVQDRIDQAALARAMQTSRTVVHGLLDPHDTSVTLATLSKASKALGAKLLRVA